jgi:predicted PolB exonuclease-like 3'-5' exonuclease
VPGAKVKLDDVSKILGLSGKPVGIDGSRVEEMVLAGQAEEVARYCETGVLNTYRVWLVYELFRGSITPGELEWSEAQIREFVATRKFPNPHGLHRGRHRSVTNKTSKNDLSTGGELEARQ